MSKHQVHSEPGRIVSAWVVLWVEPRDSRLLGKRSTMERHPQPVRLVGSLSASPLSATAQGSLLPVTLLEKAKVCLLYVQQLDCVKREWKILGLAEEEDTPRDYNALTEQANLTAFCCPWRKESDLSLKGARSLAATDD